MASRQDLTEWVWQALRHYGGRATVLDVAQYIWAQHEADLKASGNLFYTWQYDMRWAAQVLRNEGKLCAATTVPRGVWELRRMDTY